MKHQRDNMDKGGNGNDGDAMVLPLHLGDGLDNWGCEIGSKSSSDESSSSSNSESSESSESESSESESSESESSNSESSNSESSSDENSTGKGGETTTGNDAYTSFVLELQHSMTFGRSSKGFSYAKRMLRTELDSDNDSFVDGCTILIDSGGPECGKAERDGVQQLDEISLADTDDDDNSCESDDPHCDNLKGVSKNNYMDGASYFWRRRQYVMRRRRILSILAVLSLFFLMLLVMKIAVGISSSIATFDGLRIHHHKFDDNSGVDFETVEFNTIWDVDTPDMGV